MRPDASAKLAATKPKDGPSKVLIGAVIAAVLIIALVVVVIMNAQSAKSNAQGPAGSLDQGGGIVLYQDNVKAGAPTLDLYEDFQCPHCKALEASAGDAFVQVAKSGDAKVVYHPMTILDQPGTDNSLRASNASYCAADAGKFEEYHKVVFTNQPQEGVGYTDEQLKKFGEMAGITGDAKSAFDQCVDSVKYKDYAKNVQTGAEKAGVFSTPSAAINGKKVSDQTMAAFFQDPKAVAQAVEAAAK